MSADNRICLMETRWGWSGWHGSCSIDYSEPPIYGVKEFNTKKEAIDWAYTEAKDMVILEGGITFVGIDEQRLALKGIIEDTTHRLECLERWGTQFPVNPDLNFK